MFTCIGAVFSPRSLIQIIIFNFKCKKTFIHILSEIRCHVLNISYNIEAVLFSHSYFTQAVGRQCSHFVCSSALLVVIIKPHGLDHWKRLLTTVISR